MAANARAADADVNADDAENDDRPENVECTTAQDDDNMNGNICLTKLKPEGHFPAAKVLRELKTTLGGIDGFLEAMLMGDRKDPHIQGQFQVARARRGQLQPIDDCRPHVLVCWLQVQGDVFREQRLQGHV